MTYEERVARLLVMLKLKMEGETVRSYSKSQLDKAAKTLAKNDPELIQSMINLWPNRD